MEVRVTLALLTAPWLGVRNIRTVVKLDEQLGVHTEEKLLNCIL